MIVQAPKKSEYASLSFETGVYTWDRNKTNNPTSIPQLSFPSPGGICQAPNGALSFVPEGAPRIIPGIGLQAEPAATNVITNMNNVAPTSTSGWTLLNSRPTGATITLVDDTAALQASGLFSSLLADGTMSGKVVEFYNPSPDTDFAIPVFDASAGRYAFTAYVRCVTGSGYTTVTGGGGSGEVFSNTTWQRVGRLHNIGAQGRLMVKPHSTIRVILAQVELDRITSPIIVRGQAVTRQADLPSITSPRVFGGPHTIVIDGEMALQNNVERTLLDIRNDNNEGFILSRTTDGAMTANKVMGYKKPCIPRLIGPGRFRIAHRIGQEFGHFLGGAGLIALAPYVRVPAGLKKVTLGARQDGSNPFTGWIRSLKIYAELSYEKIEQITGEGVNDAFLPELRRYISPNGNDANDGRTPETPWKTMTNVKDILQFWPGTHFYFERGGTWAETLLPTNRCTYRSYGSGALPKIGSGQTYALDENAANDFRVTEIHLTGAKSRGINCYGASGVIIDRNEISGNGSLNDDNAIGAAFRGNTRRAAAVLDTVPNNVTVSTYSTSEAGLTGMFTVTCTTGGTGSATRWQAKRPDGSVITGTVSGQSGTTSIIVGGTTFSGGGLTINVSGTAVVGDVVKVRNLPFSEIGFPTNALAEDIWIENNYIHDNIGKAAGDAVYIEGIGGVCAVIGNLIPPPLGVAADCIQVGRNNHLYVANPAHAIIRNNQVAAYTGGGKGAIVCLTETCLIEGNVVKGNNFCIGFNATKAVIRWNRCYDSALYDYSWGIGVGTEFDCANAEIYGNEISTCNRGIALSGTGQSTITLDGRISRTQYRSNIKIWGNTITNCPTGFFVDRSSSGLIDKNTVKGVATKYDIRATSGPPGEALIVLGNNPSV